MDKRLGNPLTVHWLKSTENDPNYQKKRLSALRTACRNNSEKRVASKHPLGTTYGKLTVIGYEHRKDRKGGARASSGWCVRCKCACGNEKVVKFPHTLANGKTKSCGCVQLEYRDTIFQGVLPLGEAYIRSRVYAYRRSAHIRGLEFHLSDQEARELLVQPCHYCGAQPETRTSYRKFNGKIPINGIDRSNNDIGYTTGNCVPCCKQCNRAKGSLKREEFLLWARRVVKFHPI